LGKKGEKKKGGFFGEMEWPLSTRLTYDTVKPMKCPKGGTIWEKKKGSTPHGNDRRSKGIVEPP